MKPIGEGFPARLRRLRLEQHISATEIAKQLGISRPAVSNWERGRSRPRKETAAALAKLLGVSKSDLGLNQAEQRYRLSHPERQVTDRAGPMLPEAEQLTALAEVVADAKDQIASVAGTSTDRVKVIVEL